MTVVDCRRVEVFLCIIGLIILTLLKYTECIKSIVMFCGQSTELDNRCYHISPVDSCKAEISSPGDFKVKYMCGRGR